jgi:hypothetical protein
MLPTEVAALLLLIGILLIVFWALGLIVFHFGAIIYAALVLGLALLAYHWWTTGRSAQRH